MGTSAPDSELGRSLARDMVVRQVVVVPESTVHVPLEERNDEDVEEARGFLDRERVLAAGRQVGLDEVLGTEHRPGLDVGAALDEQTADGADVREVSVVRADDVRPEERQ